ncbi:TAXI family TRAP transporter solute-binding subunit [Cereibacter changlensis]|uniref:TAXI family TRAP transporter solute-binding subunit n=1 Tax=Cereibacter changlensis TaxID=402884 RepID=A0A4U0YY72_9RHOB|nr:TAXI family TRAP transporter solute-binding subunit [Cereibacter changlensis]TKA96748.1 TAXI family TRAP transporter solute-binding subunit [Cereibacter changlensis]
MSLSGKIVASAALGAALLAAPAVRAQEFINVLTGGTSGVYYPLGVALSEIYADGIEGSRTQVQATKASVENLNLLAQGKGEIAFSLGDAVALAWEGNAEAGFPQPLKNLRAIAAIYPNYIQIVAETSSGATTLADLKGMTLSVGAPASGTELNARTILDAAGMSYDDLAKVEYLPFAESAELIKNRQIQATLQSAGLGVASIKDLSATHEITVIGIPAEVVEKIGAPYAAATIPAGTYTGQEADVPTAAVGNILVTSEAVSEETAYQMTKLIFDNLERLKSAHAAAGNITLEGAMEGLLIPLHPGAERYYREAGLIQ